MPTLSSVEDKKVLDGTVVRVTDREVIIDINFKSDGIIGRSEFRYNPKLKAGDIVEVLVEKQEDIIKVIRSNLQTTLGQKMEERILSLLKVLQLLMQIPRREVHQTN